MSQKHKGTLKKFIYREKKLSMLIRIDKSRRWNAKEPQVTDPQRKRTNNAVFNTSVQAHTTKFKEFEAA